MLNNVWTTVGGIKSCTTHDACDGVVARCPFPPLFNVGNMTDVVEQCGTTSFLASPRARTSFNIGEKGERGFSWEGQGTAERGLQTLEVVQE